MKTKKHIAYAALALVAATKPIQAEKGLRADGEAPQTAASEAIYDIPRVPVKTPDAAEWNEGVGFRVEAIADPAIGVAREDFSAARCCLGWNEKGLLVFVDVRDTTPNEGAGIWDSDYVHVVVRHAVNGGEQVGYYIIPGRVLGGGEPRIEYRRGLANALDANPHGSHQFAVRKGEAGYVVELFVPWAALGVAPSLGMELGVQVLVSDHDPSGVQTPRWAQYRIPSGPDRVLQRVRLAEKASPPLLAAAGCELLNRPPRMLSDVAVRVVGDSSLAGQAATLEVDGAKVGTLVFGKVVDGWCEAFVNYSLPLAGEAQPTGMAVVLPEGGRVAVPLGNLLAERRERFERLEVEFKPWVFAGERFPDVAFKEPTLADALSGFGYKLETCFFDADCKPVERAERAGRYGAVVEVTAFGETKRRYFVLYRVPDGAALDFGYWYHHVDLRARFEGLPEGLGVDGRVWKDDPAGVVGGKFKFFLREQMERNEDLSVLLAGLSELPEEVAAGRAPLRPQYHPEARAREFRFHLRRAAGDDPMYPFLTWKPKGYDADPERRWPLVMFLHGSGERGANLSMIERSGPSAQEWLREDLPFILVSPQCPVGEWWEPTAVAALVDKICATMRVDTERIYLTGLSMGGFGTCYTAATYPERFAAIAPICGFGNVEDAVWYKDIPVWAFHGAKDDAVPVEVSREGVKRLKELKGAEVKYTEYPEGDHIIWDEVYGTRDFWTWLLEQRRKSND